MAFQPPLSVTPSAFLSSSSFLPKCHLTSTSSSHPRLPVPAAVAGRRLIPSCCSDTSSSTSAPSPSSSSSDSSSPAPAPPSEPCPPPNTFYQAITQAQSAVDAAVAAGERLLEVEFPPLPSSQLESSAVGAYEVSDANVRLAVDFARRWADAGKNVVLSFPDRVERDRIENEQAVGSRSNIRLSCLRDSRPGLLLELIWTKPEIESAVQPEDDMFIVLGASAQELPDVEKLVRDAQEKDDDKDRIVIFFNLKLDTSRGDLGLPAFPRKDLHYRFLSKVLPVYYLRTRTYSRSMARPPYIVNYSGALFKVYPGQYQVLLDTSKGSYRRLKTLDERPPLGEVRDILTDGMNLDENSKGKDGEKSFMYRGYKNRTWWEDDRTKAVSNKWRS